MDMILFVLFDLIFPDPDICIAPLIYGLIPDPINRQEVESRIDFEDLYFNEIVVGGGSNLLTT